ncbi:MAG: hypothetical protein ABIM74_04350 [candidate division WOR-3 bacterium]
MDTYELVADGLNFLRDAKDSAMVEDYLLSLKEVDPLAWLILKARYACAQWRSGEALQKGRSLLSKVAGDARLTAFLFNLLGVAQMRTGNLSAAMGWFSKVLEIDDPAVKTEAMSARLNLMACKFMMGEYGSLYRDIELATSEYSLGDNPRIRFLSAALRLIQGEPEKAFGILSYLSDEKLSISERNNGIELKGLVLRFLKRFHESRNAFITSIQGYANFGSAYAPFPCAKALQLSRFAGIEPPPVALVRKCLTLAKKGGWSEQAAAQEVKALLIEDDRECSEALFAAAQGYSRANQLFEACLTGLSAAYLAWKTESSVFPSVLKFLAHLAPLHPGFKCDPILGKFFQKIEPLLFDEGGENRGIRAYLIGGLRVYVGGEKIHPLNWRSKRAAKALIYLLLSPNHRIPTDHLFYLLWPRRDYKKPGNKALLYKAIYTIREALGDRALLTKRHDFYQLEDVWTDLCEIESLMRLADTARDPAEKEEYLARARKFAGGELLPELPYDRHIEEFKEHYKRLRKRLGLE